MENKEQIVRGVRQIDELRTSIARHWTMVQKCVADNQKDEAITLLNRYFSLRGQLEREEANLAGILHGYFSEK